MNDYINIDFAGAKRGAEKLEAAGEGIGVVGSDLTTARTKSENPPVWGTDEIAEGFKRNYMPLADQLTKLVQSYHQTLTGPNGVPAVLADAVAKQGRVDQAAADGFAANTGMREA